MALYSMSLNAPGLWPSLQCSPSVCAEVHASVRERLEEGDVDGLVRSRLSSEGGGARTIATGSRLLRQVSEVSMLTGEKDPLAAMTSLLHEGAQAAAIPQKREKRPAGVPRPLSTRAEEDSPLTHIF